MELFGKMKRSSLVLAAIIGVPIAGRSETLIAAGLMKTPESPLVPRAYVAESVPQRKNLRQRLKG